MPSSGGESAQADVLDITAEFVAALAQRADEAERLRRLPAATISDFKACGLATLLLPARFGGRQAEFSQLLDPVRRMAHGCASSAWTLGFYTLHNWMLSLLDIEAQEEVFAWGRSWPRPCAHRPRRRRRRRHPVDRPVVVGDRNHGRRLGDRRRPHRRRREHLSGAGGVASGRDRGHRRVGHRGHVGTAPTTSSSPTFSSRCAGL